MKPNQEVKNRFDLKTDEEKMEILHRYIEKYKHGSIDALITLALQYNVAGQLVTNPNYVF
jgi:hypothetical protein